MPARKNAPIRERFKTLPDSAIADPPWERAKGETHDSFIAFRLYLMQGDDRQLKRVSMELGHKQLKVVQRWSTQYRWVERAEAYTDAWQSQLLETNEDAILEAHKLIRAKARELVMDLLWLAKHGDKADSVRLQAILASLNRIGVIEFKQLVITDGDGNAMRYIAEIPPQLAPGEWNKQVDEAIQEADFEVLDVAESGNSGNGRKKRRKKLG